uniref:MLLT3 super elongation complex subunit n=1 Tax=Maylandia zebra TaxID=106582 RepID=A0A3P9DUM2_9CICH
MATTTSSDNSSISKLHKPFKDHIDKTSKDLKDPKSAFRDSGWEPGKAPKESSRKPKENQPLREINPKMGFKQPKSLSKERRTEGITHASRLNKRLSGLEGDDHGTKRRKKGFVNSSEMQISELDGPCLDKKLLRDRSQLHSSKLRAESEDADLRSVSTLPPFQDLVDANDSDMEDQSARSDVSKRDALLSLQLGMSSSTDNSFNVFILCDFILRISLSDGSRSDSSSHSPLSCSEAPPLLKSTNNQIVEVKSPTKQSKQDKSMECDKVYLDELVELHKRLMTLREGHILQQSNIIIEKTKHHHNKLASHRYQYLLSNKRYCAARKIDSAQCALRQQPRKL